LKECFYIKV